MPHFDSSGALHLFGVSLIGATPENLRKLLITAAFIVAVTLAGRILRWATEHIIHRLAGDRTAFWSRQAVSIALSVLLLLGVLSIWFDDPNRLATALGLITAGLAFALQRVITATAGYLIILRGKTFNVGDRIVMGGVRGDVVALSFMQTTIMEMGQAKSEQADSPGMWVQSRQYTGRIVTVSNAKVFDEPVYNYTRDFPYIWEEIRVPVRYQDDRARAEAILLDAARSHAEKIGQLGAEDAKEIQRRYDLRTTNFEPRVFWRLTDNWLELTLRFLAHDHGIRELKDAMSRDILAGFDEAGMQIASSTYEIVGIPKISVETFAPRA